MCNTGSENMCFSCCRKTESSGERKSERAGSLCPITGLTYEGGSEIQLLETPFLVADKV